MSSVTLEDNSREALAAKDMAIARALEAIGIRAVGLVSQRTPVDTGRLRASNDYEVRGNSVAIGNVQDYAPYVELGHKQEPGRFVPGIGKDGKGARLKAKFVPAQPFLGPGVTSGIDDYRKIIERELRSGG